MIRVAAITSGREVPSARFRVRQHIPHLRGFGIDVREYAPGVDKYAPMPVSLQKLNADFRVPYVLVERAWRGVKQATRIPGIVGSWQGRITWLERQLLPGYLTSERLLKRPLVFDVDDAIWLHPPAGKEAVDRIARFADVVVAGNGYIAEWFSERSRDIRVIPTGVDTDRFRPGNGDRASGRGDFVIGWIGTSFNLQFLESIEGAIRKFLADHEEARFHVVSDKPPTLMESTGRRILHIPWSVAIETEALRQMDLGIMPLPDTEWTRGKCSFKMLQYMACAIPVVVSPVGMNAEILRMGNVGLPASCEEDWYEAFSHFYRNREVAREVGQNGWRLAESRFSLKVVTPLLADLFKELS